MGDREAAIGGDEGFDYSLVGDGVADSNSSCYVEVNVVAAEVCFEVFLDDGDEEVEAV